MVLRNGNLFADGQGVRVGGGYKVCEAAEGASEGAGGAEQKEKRGISGVCEEISGFSCGRGCLRHFIKLLRVRKLR